MEVRDSIPFVITILVVIGALFMIKAGGAIYGLGIALLLIAIIGGFWSINRYFDRRSRFHN